MSSQAEINAASKEILQDDDASALALITICLRAFGENIFHDPSVVLFNELEHMFNASIPEENENRINAALTSMTSDIIEVSPEIMAATALAFTEGDIGDAVTGMLEEVSGAALLWTMHEVALLRGESVDELSSRLSPDVLSMVEREIASESAALEDVSDEVDTVEEALRDPYYMHYMRTRQQELIRELRMLGADDSTISLMQL